MSYLVEETSKVRPTERHRTASLREALLLAERKAPLVLTDWVHVRQERHPLVSLRFRHTTRTSEPDGVASGEYEYEWHDEDAKLLHAQMKGVRTVKPGPRSRASSLAERSMNYGASATV